MPLTPGKSPKTVSKNISEIMHSYAAKGSIGTSRPKDKKAAQHQAVAISLSNARKYGRQMGGSSPPPMFMRSAARNLMREGLIRSQIPGRTDKLNIGVPSGSSIIPADVVSGLGQGNTLSGADILGKMFSTGPYGMKLPRAGTPRMRYPRMLRADGGETDNGDDSITQIMAAGGEFIVGPDKVAEIGGGDLDHGHAIMNQFIKSAREKHVKTISKLPGPHE